jgi:hypothetical protein
MYNIFKYLPLIYINHNRDKITHHISLLCKKNNLHFIPHIVNTKLNYFLDLYYKKIKR